MKQTKQELINKEEEEEEEEEEEDDDHEIWCSTKKKR
jgi:hypothetical protein